MLRKKGVTVPESQARLSLPERKVGGKKPPIVYRDDDCKLSDRDRASLELPHVT